MTKNIKIDRITHFIDNITVTYYSDGKRGFFAARGYTYFPQDNSVVTFEAKFTCSLMKHIIKELNSYTVLGNGTFIINDERKTLKIETTIKNSHNCTPMYKELSELKKLKTENNPNTYNEILKLFNIARV